MMAEGAASSGRIIGLKATASWRAVAGREEGQAGEGQRGELDEGRFEAGGEVGQDGVVAGEVEQGNVELGAVGRGDGAIEHDQAEREGEEDGDAEAVDDEVVIGREPRAGWREQHPCGTAVALDVGAGVVHQADAVEDGVVRVAEIDVGVVHQPAVAIDEGRRRRR
jgi:hypothetical protein